MLQHPWVTQKEQKILIKRRKSGDASMAEQMKAFAITEEFLLQNSKLVGDEGDDDDA